MSTYFFKSWNGAQFVTVHVSRVMVDDPRDSEWDTKAQAWVNAKSGREVVVWTNVGIAYSIERNA